MQNTISLTSVEIKEARTQNPVLPLIKKRWSARSFSARKIEQPVLDTILEAASWAASGNNEQPWRYRYAVRPDNAFGKLHDLLLPGNHPWAGNAAALIISSYKTNFQFSGKPNLTAMHDLGMANAQLMLQAVALGIYAHPMAGFDKPRLIREYGFGENEIPVVVIALGYLNDPEKLEEPFRTREITGRTRKSIEDLVSRLN